MKLYKKLFSYIPERKLHGIFACLLTTVGIVLEFYAYYLIWILLKNVFSGGVLSEERSLAIKILFLFIAYGILYFMGLWMSHLAGFRLETRLRERGIRHLLGASNTFFDLHNSGEVRKIIDNNVEQTHMIVAHLIPDQTAAFLTPILMIILTFVLDLYLGIFFIVIVLISLVLVKNMMGDQSFMKKYMDMLDEMNAGAVEYVRAMPVVKIFNAPLIGFKKLYDSILIYKEMVYKYSMSCRFPFVLFQWLLNIFIITPIFFGIFMVNRGADPGLWAAKILFFTLFMGIFYSNTMKIMYVSMYIFQANSAVDNLENLFKEMKEKEIEFGSQREFLNKNIEFKNVDFSYDGENKILDNFSLSLEEDKVYALVGSSGSGKSTIAKLISGLYPVDSGEILIGDKNISSYDKESLMKNIGIVFQNPQLFQGISIFENVKLAKSDASDEEVLRALKIARCDEFIYKFKDAYDVVIGAEGVNLSGGEKQRVSIARIFLKDPKIIIMDEASAAADPENEYELQIAFKELIKNRTTIMIAHRLTSIRGVDEILLIEDGKLIERGSHDILYKEDSKYKKFVEMYNSANEWRVD
ncbi:ABC transporter ATP-binding protein [Peptoniphilus harei]|uniref:Multidrug export ATP-binding/permease protein SAV1866 n=1 Tax=Peptoniphilus harei TaxID=54005 RepID=A0A2X1XZV0_9FIRM|nr:ABC transporter ATP-binding protein [Peptoniphilus harei]QQT91303.1 ABC transporter ATP-binding protein [Peptoniphilus harei]SPY48948.1 Putative multidrug export ATP-binding/permease protein SAV1866 [Peptoniphilus harei]